MSGGDDGFLSRWQRRKAAVAQEAEAETPAPEAAPGPEPQPERSDDEVLAELGLSHPEALEDEGDLRDFLAAAVPEHLRRLALRKLWRSNPVLANLDGLVDYGDDYTGTGDAGGPVQTAYRVGKGFLSRLEQAAEVAAEDPPDPPAPEAPPPDTPPQAPPDTAPAVVAQAPAAAADDPGPPPRRRMRFKVPQN